jgi:hypothetical protein
VYTYLGCYRDGSGGPYAGGRQTLPVSLSRTGVSTDECAVAARGRGYPVFSLQGYGTCFMGSMADVAKMNAASQQTTDAMCSAIPCPAAAATCIGSVNKVFWLEGKPGLFLVTKAEWTKQEGHH